MHVWRLVRAQHRRKPLDGGGASLFGGRWNPVGTPIAYCAISLELAVLEGLVQVHPEELMHARYYWMEFSLPDDAVETPERLPQHWSSPGPHRPEVQAVGLNWVKSKRALALRVPSAVLPERSNILLNPAHPRFAEVASVASAAFTWPHRLLDYLSSL